MKISVNWDDDDAYDDYDDKYDNENKPIAPNLFAPGLYRSTVYGEEERCKSILGPPLFWAPL